MGAISVLLTGAGSILIDFEDMINSLEDEEDEELLRRTSLLVQTQRGASRIVFCPVWWSKLPFPSAVHSIVGTTPFRQSWLKCSSLSSEKSAEREGS